jgi:hypothetical protein
LFIFRRTWLKLIYRGIGILLGEDMQRMVFLIGCIALVNAPISAQIASFSQRGKATQGIPGGGFSIAHPNLPINSQVKVTNTANGKEVEATVIDRVPASNDRIADVSRGVWDALGLNPDTDIILSVSPPPRPRTTEPVPAPPAGLAGNPPSTAPPVPPSPTSSSAPAAAESRPTAQETNPASNGDIYITLKNMLREVVRENQSASPPSTQVITVYPPYPPQSVVTTQSVINDSVPVNTANPQVSAAQPAYPQISAAQPVYPQAPAAQPAYPQVSAAQPSYVPPPYQAPPVQAVPLYQPYQAPVLPALPPQRPALPAAPPDQDCTANSTPPPTKLQVIPRLPNPNGREIYRLQVGAFCDPGSANGLENRLRAVGFNVAREYYNTLHRVLVTGIPAAMVQSTVQRLDAMGIKQIWVRQ